MQLTRPASEIVDVDAPDVVAFRDDLNRRVAADRAGDIHGALIATFRATGGQVGGVFAGAPLLLLTTTGATSGRQHTVPVLYTRDGDRYVVLASKAGAPTNPSWYHNLLAQPAALLELGWESFAVTAAVAEGQERDRLFAQHVAQLPIYADYQRQTRRRIPVLILQRRWRSRGRSLPQRGPTA